MALKEDIAEEKADYELESEFDGFGSESESESVPKSVSEPFNNFIEEVNKIAEAAEAAKKAAEQQQQHKAQQQQQQKQQKQQQQHAEAVNLKQHSENQICLNLNLNKKNRFMH